MPAENMLEGLDPYDLMDTEAARIDRHLSTLGPAQQAAPSVCEGWSVKDVVGHLAASEEYNHACLDDSLGALFQRLSASGANDLDSFNAYGVEQLRPVAFGAVVEQWRDACGRTRRELRARDGGDVSTMVGPYPVRWQAFHLTAELATHADDIGAPVDSREEAARTEWRARFAVFAISETKPDVSIELDRARARVAVDGAETTMSLPQFLAVANGRYRGDDVDQHVRSALNVVGS
jgi:uncharacterized protein (TIGR03083 family)